MAQGDHGFVDLILAAQIIRHLPVTGLDRAAAVLDNDLLIRNQLRNDRCDLQLPPAVGDDGEAPLDITHGGGQMLELLQLQMVHQFTHRIGVGADGPVHPLLTVETEDVQDILVTIVVLLDLRALVINAVNQIAQRIVDLVPEGAALDLQFFALYKDAGVQDLQEENIMFLPLTMFDINSFRRLQNVLYRHILLLEKNNCLAYAKVEMCFLMNS